MEEAICIATELVRPGRWLVEILPLLRFVPAWMPGAEFKRKATRTRERLRGLDLFPFNWTKEQIKSGNYIDSFTSMALHPDGDKLVSSEEADIIKWCGSALYVGGADTTVSAMTTFFLMMTVYPDVQRRAQAEIDRVVGKDRLTTIEDQKALPFTMAVIKEVLRFAPVVPTGLPHCVTRDDVYQGFRIPKGATVIANIWAITRDSKMYPNPSTFDPERFMARPGVEPQIDPRKWIFGFGRRVCPGAHFAETSIFLNITGILATFNISKFVTKDGQEVEPEIGSVSHGVICHPKPFDCRITPRSPDLLASMNMA
jgi:cytochrome P450